MSRRSEGDMGCNLGRNKIDSETDINRNKDINEINNANNQFTIPTEEDEPEEKSTLNEAATRIQAAFRGYQTRLNIRKMKANNNNGDPEQNDELADIDLKDPELSKAASKIQATFRGHKGRKPSNDPPPPQTPPEEPKVDDTSQLSDELKDLDMEDPQLEKAAVKIQSTFRGYKTRSGSDQ